MVPSPCCRWSGTAGMPPRTSTPPPRSRPSSPLGVAMRGSAEPARQCDVATEGIRLREAAGIRRGIPGSAAAGQAAGDLGTAARTRAQLRRPSATDCCAQNCAHLCSTVAGVGSHSDGMNGRQFIARVRRWARSRDLKVRFVASGGAGSHGTLHAGERRTTVKDRKKEIGKGLLAKMLADLGIDRDDF